MDHKQIIIIGAGPAGLSTAVELLKHGHHVTVVEASESVGGMSRSFKLWDQIVDLGPHRFFSNNPRIIDFFKKAIGDDFTVVNRLTRIYFSKSFFYYPLRLSNVLLNLQPLTIFQIIFYYLLQRVRPIQNPNTFEEWVTNRFGKKLFEIFFKNYSEKLWGIPCSKIDADWAAQRIKTLSLWGAVWSALTSNSGNKHKTLVDQFAYPNKGTGQIYENLAKTCRELGGKILFNAPVVKILTNDQQAYGVVLSDGAELHADIVVSTMPITLMLQGLEHVPHSVSASAEKLYFRNTILVYLEIDQLDLFDDNWIYVHSPEVLHGRITNFRNWSPEITQGMQTSILCLEYWSFDHDEIWKKSDDELGALASEELFTIELIPPDAKVLNYKVVRIKRCYPVYETGYMHNLQPIIEYLKSIKALHVIGRYGAFKYNNQDHSILMGLLCADIINDNRNDIDLWSINTDTEYQESGEIKDVLIG